jgi:hypothetical protein
VTALVHRSEETQNAAPVMDAAFVIYKKTQYWPTPFLVASEPSRTQKCELFLLFSHS